MVEANGGRLKQSIDASPAARLAKSHSELIIASSRSLIEAPRAPAACLGARIIKV